MAEDLFRFDSKASAQALQSARDHVVLPRQVVNLARATERDRDDGGIGHDVTEILGIGDDNGDAFV